MWITYLYCGIECYKIVCKWDEVVNYKNSLKTMKITKIVSKVIVSGVEQETVLYKMKGMKVRELVLVKKSSPSKILNSKL